MRDGSLPGKTLPCSQPWRTWRSLLRLYRMVSSLESTSKPPPLNQNAVLSLSWDLPAREDMCYLFPSSSKEALHIGLIWRTRSYTDWSWDCSRKLGWSFIMPYLTSLFSVRRDGRLKHMKIQCCCTTLFTLNCLIALGLWFLSMARLLTGRGSSLSVRSVSSRCQTRLCAPITLGTLPFCWRYFRALSQTLRSLKSTRTYIELSASSSLNRSSPCSKEAYASLRVDWGRGRELWIKGSRCLTKTLRNVPISQKAST